MDKINVDLFGWDTSFGTSFTNANKSITSQKSTPKAFAHGDDKAVGSISGTWDSWSLTLNGDGQNVNLKCPINAGTYYCELPQNKDKTVLLGSQWLEVQIRLDAFDSDSPYFDKTSEKDSGQIQNLKAKTDGGSSIHPIVSIYAQSFDENSPIFKDLELAEAEVAICQSAFKDYFKDNLDKFNNIFSTFIINAKADKGHFQWLKPTKVNYAIATTESADTSMLSVLCMTENRPSPTSGNATDPRLLAAANADSVFAITQKRFLEKWLMPGIVLGNAGTSLNDYFMFSDTLISNNKDLTFKNRVTNKDNNATDLIVPKGNFKMGIFDTQVEMKFEGMHFEWASGITCEVNYVDYFNLSLLPGNGHNALHITPINKLPDMQVIMQVADWRQKRDMWIEIGVSIGVAVVGAVLGPAIGPVLGKAFGAVADSAVAKAISAGLDSAFVSITEAIERVAATEVGQMISAALEASGTLISDIIERIGGLSVGESTISEVADKIATYIAGKATSIGNFMMTNRYLIIGGMIGGVTGTLLGNIPKIITANDKASIPDMASLNEFAENAVGTIKWPSGVFQLSSAQLDGALLLGGKIV